MDEAARFEAALAAAETRLMVRIAEVNGRVEDMAFCSKSHGTTLERIADTAERTDRRVAAVVRRVRKTTGGKPDQFVQKLILWLIIANVAGAVAGALGKEGLELLLRALGTPAGG